MTWKTELFIQESLFPKPPCKQDASQLEKPSLAVFEEIKLLVLLNYTQLSRYPHTGKLALIK